MQLFVGKTHRAYPVDTFVMFLPAAAAAVTRKYCKDSAFPAGQSMKFQLDQLATGKHIVCRCIQR